MSLSELQKMQAYDNPISSLTEPMDLYALKGVQDQVAVAVDFDDTCVSTGGWRLLGTGTYLGGVDGSYPRGTGYPGIGGLMYMLSMGRQRRQQGKLKPVSSQVLPVVLTSARPSTRIIFRPKWLYKHLAVIYAREASLLGAELLNTSARVKYENRIALLHAAVAGAAARQPVHGEFHSGKCHAGIHTFQLGALQLHLRI